MIKELFEQLENIEGKETKQYIIVGLEFGMIHTEYACTPRQLENMIIQIVEQNHHRIDIDKIIFNIKQLKTKQ